MKKKWKKIRTGYDVMAPVVGSGSIASYDVANGRNIPVVIVEPDSKKIIDSIISVHRNISYGHCDSKWGLTDDHKNILLVLEFKDPISSKILISFDFIKYGMVVDQIIYAQCTYLMTGEAGTKLSDNLGRPMVLLEIPVEEFAEEWNRIYRKAIVNYIHKKYKSSWAEANEIFNKIQQTLKPIRTLRIK